MKYKSYAFLTACLAVGYLCLSQGVNEQSAYLIYFFPVFFYFVISRLSIVKSAVAGLAIGALFAATSYSWISKFARPEPYHMTIVFNGLVFLFSFAFASFLIKKFQRHEFAHIFSLGIGFYILRTIAHYSPVLPYAKAFITVSNAPTVFDWLVPYFGSSVVDVLILASGFLCARIAIHARSRQLPNHILAYSVLFGILAIGSMIVPAMKSRADAARPTVKVALVQGNFDWSWDTRVQNTDQMLEYFITESTMAAKQGAKIIIWPEYAVPKDILHDEQKIAETITRLSRKLDAVIVFGSLEMVGPPRPGGKWNGYDLSLVFDPKRNLLKPYRAVFPFTDIVLSGTKPTIFESEFAGFPVISCFEVANHKFVSDYTRLGRPVDFFIGIANIQLFNGTAGHARIKNHLRRITAENGKYFVYVANTGPSIVFDRSGNALASTHSGERATLIIDIPKIPATTVYSKLQEFPLTFLLLSPLAYFTVASRHKKGKKRY